MTVEQSMKTKNIKFTYFGLNYKGGYYTIHGTGYFDNNEK